MTFDESFEKLIGHEGGYVNDPRDAGGETKYGISKRSYPGEDIFNLTLERAKQIYKKDFWGPAGCDTIPEELRFDVFDMAVNSGVKAAIKTLQKTAGMPDYDIDGVLGPKTLMAIQSISKVKLLIRFNAERLMFYTTLRDWPAFGKGWARRVANNLLSI